MRALRGIVLLLAAGLAGIACDDEITRPVSQVDSPFVGTWDLIALDGSSPPPSSMRITFTQTEVFVSSGGIGVWGTYTFDATTDPKRLDVSAPGLRPNPNLAIYVFTGPTLLVKLQDGATARATAFSVQQGYSLMEFARVN